MQERTLFVNKLDHRDVDNHLFCDTIIDLRAIVGVAQTSISGFLRWYIDGIEQTEKTDTLEWQKKISIGNHTVAMDIVSISNDTTRLSASFNVDIAYYDTIIATICLGERYNLYNFDTVPTATGFIQYSQNLTTMLGCDSIVTLNLTINPSYSDTITASICLGERYNLYNFDTIPTTAGFIQYSQNKTNTLGCDSMITLKLTVNQIYWQDSVAICDNDLPYIYGDSTFTTAGIYSVFFQSVQGCDSIISLTLTVNPIYNLHDNLTICDNDLPYTYGDTTFALGSKSGTYLFHFATINGCDSVISLNLTINPMQNSKFEITSENFYEWNGTEYTVSGHYTQIFQAENGCDSLVTLHLVLELKQIAIWLPNAFTPNGDNLNDVFKPVIQNIELLKEYEMLIYDRWGSLVFRTQDYQIGWTGNDASNYPYAAGVYSCLIRLTDISGKKIMRTTSVCLTR
jgi:gliding motility-associated-like protein